MNDNAANDIDASRIPVIAANGSQSLAETIEIIASAENAGADALLIVTPYYIKPSQAGLVEYFATIGQRTGLPLMIHHNPSHRPAYRVWPAAVARVMPSTMKKDETRSELAVGGPFQLAGRDLRGDHRIAFSW